MTPVGASYDRGGPAQLRVSLVAASEMPKRMPLPRPQPRKEEALSCLYLVASAQCFRDDGNEQWIVEKRAHCPLAS